MKRLILLHLLLALVIETCAEPYIIIGDLKLVRVPSAVRTDGLREYIIEGDTVERWTRLASVRVFPNQRDPKAFLSAVAAGVRKTDPNARHQFYQNKRTKNITLDFMVFPPRGEPRRYDAEWNLMRAEYQKGRGLVVYQYAMRLYRSGTEGAKLINTEREKMLDPFQQASFDEKEEPSEALGK